MKASDNAILITGAGGYLGSRLAKCQLELERRPVILWVHAESGDELEKKSAQMRAAMGPVAETAVVRGGDLRSPEPFADIDPAEIDTIIHAAAVTRFNVERDLAESVNVEGAVKLYDFASRCKNLERLALLSSIYACGLSTGNIQEEPLHREPEFANHYERSKWESERQLIDRFGSLPWMILRVATVIAEDPNGTVTQYNAFHNTLKLLFYGLVSLIPGNRETPLYFVTTNFVADAVSAALERGETGTVYHVCHGRDESLTLGHLIDAAFERFRADPDFAERRILKPLFCDESTFTMLADGIDAFGGDVVRQGLASIVPFAAQLFSEKSFDNRRLRASLERYEAPDALRLVDNTCDYLARTRWGTRFENAA